MLEKVDYEYSQATNSWCAILKQLPGVYAQANSIEQVRKQIIEVMEDYIIISLQKGHKLPSFYPKACKVKKCEQHQFAYA